MKTWEVEVHLGSGGDTDSIATYLVYAEDEGDAEDTAIGESRHLINATANLIRFEKAVDEMDYDGVLMSERSKGLKHFREDEAAHERMTGQNVDSGRLTDSGYERPYAYDQADETGYSPRDPKHPTYHERMSDAADARDS